MSKLPIKQRLFCYFYLKLGNVQEAATKAGFAHFEALAQGLKLLEQPRVRAYLQTLEEALPVPSRTTLVRAGLERLALGACNDAVALALREEPPSEAEIAALDLYNVAELKRPKGGGLEIKFFDRQKALERLWEVQQAQNGSDAADSFLTALQLAANGGGEGTL